MKTQHNGIALRRNPFASPALTLVGLTALALSSGARQVRADGGASDDVVRTQRLEIIDGEGRVVAEVGSNEHGGTFALYRPAADPEEKPKPFAFVGCSFETGAEIVLVDPTGQSKTGITIGTTGEPRYATVTGYALNGKPTFMLGGVSSTSPVLKLWDPGTDELRSEQ